MTRVDFQRCQLVIQLFQILCGGRLERKSLDLHRGLGKLSSEAAVFVNFKFFQLIIELHATAGLGFHRRSLYFAYLPSPCDAKVK
jgi:hypothetical protein